MRRALAVCAVMLVSFLTGYGAASLGIDQTRRRYREHEALVDERVLRWNDTGEWVEASEVERRTRPEPYGGRNVVEPTDAEESWVRSLRRPGGLPGVPSLRSN